MPFSHFIIVMGNLLIFAVPTLPYFPKFPTEAYGHVDVGFLGGNTVCTCRYIPAFQGNVLPLFSALEAVDSSKNLVSVYKFTWCCCPENQH
jgi:hypothetical protein